MLVLLSVCLCAKWGNMNEARATTTKSQQQPSLNHYESELAKVAKYDSRHTDSELFRFAVEVRRRPE